MNDNPEIMPGHTLVLDVRDIKKDRYVGRVADESSFEAMTVTRDLIVSHLNSSTQGPIVAIVGAANE